MPLRTAQPDFLALGTSKTGAQSSILGEGSWPAPCRWSPTRARAVVRRRRSQAVLFDMRKLRPPRRGREFPRPHSESVAERDWSPGERGPRTGRPGPPPHPAHPLTSPRFIATSAPSCPRAALPSCPAPATPWRGTEPRSCPRELGKRAALTGALRGEEEEEPGPGPELHSLAGDQTPRPRPPKIRGAAPQAAGPGRCRTAGAAAASRQEQDGAGGSWGGPARSVAEWTSRH